MNIQGLKQYQERANLMGGIFSSKKFSCCQDASIFILVLNKLFCFIKQVILLPQFFQRVPCQLTYLIYIVFVEGGFSRILFSAQWIYWFGQFIRSRQQARAVSQIKHHISQITVAVSFVHTIETKLCNIPSTFSLISRILIYQRIKRRLI